METIQQQIGAMQEEIKRLREELEVVKKGNFDTITCKGWSVVDEDGEKRITAYAKFDWADVTLGVASVDWFDKGGQLRIAARIIDDGYAGVELKDKDGKSRITAATHAEGTVELPTEDFDPPKKP